MSGSCETSDGTALVAKQASDAAGSQRLALEAAVCRRLRGVKVDRPFLPRHVTYHDRQGLLVMDYVDGESLADIVDRRIRDGRAAAATLGRTLARVHQFPLKETEGYLDAEPPAALCIHRPDLGWYSRSSEASLRMRASIQHDRELARSLDVLRETWTATTIIHADLKLEHVLVSHPSRITIIDWEAAKRGDSAWDIGTVFAGYLLRWLRSIPIRSGHEIAEMIDQATIPLQRIQPSLIAFWQGYMLEAALDGRLRRDLLIKATCSAAAMLLQREDEFLQAAHASPARTAMILSVSRNMLLHPLDGSGVLLGLDTGVSNT